MKSEIQLWIYEQCFIEGIWRFTNLLISNKIYDIRERFWEASTWVASYNPNNEEAMSLINKIPRKQKVNAGFTKDKNIELVDG